MTTTINLFRRASGTNSEFHLDGRKINCEIVQRAGLGPCYVYQTSDASEARRLQIIHGFKIEAGGPVRAASAPNVDRQQVEALATEQAAQKAETKKAAPKKKPAGRRRTKAKPKAD